MNNQENIILDATELIAQSDSMKALREEYNAMFSQVTSVLNQMNDGWSENLSNNFVGKIATAQKGFAKICEFLECGEMVAKEAATSFEDINAVMARQISGSFSNLFSNVPLIQPAFNLLNNHDFMNSWLHNKDKFSLYDLQNLDFSDKTSISKIIEQLENVEPEVFNTEYIKNIKGLIDDITHGNFSSDTIDRITDVLPLDKLMQSLGFSADNIAYSLIKDGLKKMIGDGKTLESRSPASLEMFNNIYDAYNNFSEGNYTEACVEYVARLFEGSTKVVAESTVDLTSEFFNDIVDELGLTDIVNESWDNLNNYTINEHGIDLNIFFPEWGKEMSNTWHDMVTNSIDFTVTGIDRISDGIASVENIFDNIPGFLSDLF